MKKAEYRNLSAPDETRTFPRGKLELIRIGEGSVGRFTLEPGWRWSEHVKPLARTSWCEASHFQYQISGRLHVKMEDGSEFDLKPGDVCRLPAGHDAWVVGKEPVVLVDWHGAGAYAKG